MRSDRGAHGAAGPTSTAHKNTPRSACYDAGVCKGELLTAAEITKNKLVNGCPGPVWRHIG